MVLERCGGDGLEYTLNKFRIISLGNNKRCLTQYDTWVDIDIRISTLPIRFN